MGSVINGSVLNMLLLRDGWTIEIDRLTDEGVECIDFVSSQKALESFLSAHSERMWAIRTDDSHAMIIVE